MTVGNAIKRFAMAFAAIMVLANVVVNLFGVNIGGGADMGALIAGTMWACHSFAKENGRYFSKGEKAKLVFGMLAADLAVQSVLLLVSGLWSKQEVGVNGSLIALVIVGVFHLPTIYFFVSMERRFLAKQGVIETEVKASTAERSAPTT